MNKELDKFITIYLNEMQAADVSGYLRPTLHGFGEEYIAAVREGLATTLSTRSLSLTDYVRLTDIEFDSEEALYSYLLDMQEYLFGDRPRQPAPPA
ncbi:hypothetical protein AB0I16_18920 [Streptomyces sp. NPDC050703]|uniref:hypothetical protein n=1 Tax=Streptomyces sp. NPDC050703 TaxID=3157218 RepID=UPI00341434D3